MEPISKPLLSHLQTAGKETYQQQVLQEVRNPQTPYQRLIESTHITPENKKKLFACNQDLNPFNLKKEIEVKLRKIFKMIKVTSNVRKRI